jgi:cytoskeletal protein RodZ
MPSAGELLRAERTKRNRSLSEIADSTCISKRYLEAIEIDRVRDLPGEFFYKAFIRQYAKALGLDDASTSRILSCAVPCDTEDPLPVMNEVYHNAQVGKPTRWNAPTGLAIGLLLLVLAVCSGFYALWQHIEAKREAADAAVMAQRAQSAAVPETQPAPVAQPPAPVAQPNEAPPPPAETAAAPATVPEAEPGKISIDVAATEETWVSVSSEGRTIFSGILDAGQTKQFAVAENARLTTGNAAGLEVRLNGKPIGTIGPRGQVRNVVFTADNAQVVVPRPGPPKQPVVATP